MQPVKIGQNDVIMVKQAFGETKDSEYDEQSWNEKRLLMQIRLLEKMTNIGIPLVFLIFIISYFTIVMNT